jgi:hypothetical protein
VHGVDSRSDVEHAGADDKDNGDTGNEDGERCLG